MSESNLRIYFTALSEIHLHSCVTDGCCSKLRASSSGTNSWSCKIPSSAGKWDDTRAHRPLPEGSRDMFQESVLSGARLSDCSCPAYLLSLQLTPSRNSFHSPEHSLLKNEISPMSCFLSPSFLPSPLPLFLLREHLTWPGWL